MKAITTMQLVDIQMALREKAMDCRDLAGHTMDEETRAYFQKREGELLDLYEQMGEICRRIYKSEPGRVRICCKL